MTRRIRWTSLLTATVRSFTNDVDRYDLAINGDCSVTCTCADFRFRRQPCKHIKKLAKSFIRKNGSGK